jgi:hypothetical protein
MLNGVPKSDHEFKDMVASGAPEDLASEEGLRLIACLDKVTFIRHPQQINVLDKTSGKIIASLLA